MYYKCEVRGSNKIGAYTCEVLFKFNGEMIDAIKFASQNKKEDVRNVRAVANERGFHKFSVADCESNPDWVRINGAKGEFLFEGECYGGNVWREGEQFFSFSGGKILQHNSQLDARMAVANAQY